MLHKSVKLCYTTKPIGKRGVNSLEARLSHINRRETLQYLSYRGSAPDEAVAADLDRCEAAVMQAATPRIVWRLFPIEPDGTLGGSRFRPEGESIRALLATCHGAILMAATLGAAVDALIRKNLHSHMGDAVIMDAAASAAIENVCDNLCEDLAAAFAPRFLTDRFSPGYGDFPLAQQRELCQVLDITRRIGVSLTESGLMLPQKTVTALIGVSDQAQPKRHRGCAYCNMYENCAFRKEGTGCGVS